MGYRRFACGHDPTGRDACPVCGSVDLVERCTCGSGGHPNPCDLHPDLAELDAENEAPAAPPEPLWKRQDCRCGCRGDEYVPR